MYSTLKVGKVGTQASRALTMDKSNNSLHFYVVDSCTILLTT